ncbi:hypothetical protein QE152_g23662 [Popillia japonica]|uniref:Uncharacterized protein n=1 Tax=Popillia japonica TaxID=7064 RepID=A0AAW1KEJ5_POPJA
MLNCWWETSSDAADVDTGADGELPSAPRHEETPLKSTAKPCLTFYERKRCSVICYRHPPYTKDKPQTSLSLSHAVQLYPGRDGADDRRNYLTLGGEG